MPKRFIGESEIDDAINEISTFSGESAEISDRKRHAYRSTAIIIIDSIEGALFEDRLNESSSYDEVCKVVKSSLGMFVMWFIGKQVIYWLAGILWRKMFPEIDLGWQSSGVGAVASSDQNR